MQVHLGDTPNNLTESDFETLARKTEGFSGSDIAVCVRAVFYFYCRDSNLAFWVLFTSADSASCGFCRLRMFCLNLYVKLRMPCSLLTHMMICGYHVGQNNEGLSRSPCRILQQKVWRQR